MARFKTPYLFPYRFVIAAAVLLGGSVVLALVLWRLNG